MDIITSAINDYTNIFSSCLEQFLQWGKWLFYTCSIISIVWLCLWRAFDHDSFVNAMSGFIKEFFIITLFYTIMINAGPWLYSIVDTASSMGITLAHQKVDPSSIITQGFAIANTLLLAANNTIFLTNGFSILIAGASYMIILFAFGAVALDLAVTIIFNSILISLASMSLALAIFACTRSAARKTLDMVITNSIKLLILYVVIAAGSSLITKIADLIPEDKITSFDIFGWVVVSCLLFWIVARYIPKNIAKIFTDMLQEYRFSSDLLAVQKNDFRTASSVDSHFSSDSKIPITTANIVAAAFSSDDNQNTNSQKLSGKNKEYSDSGHGNLSEHFKYIVNKKKS